MADEPAAMVASTEPQSPAAPTTEPVAKSKTDRDLVAEARLRRIVTGGHATNVYKLINPPRDKRVKMISERDKARGLYYDWDTYTPEHWKADQEKYGTDFAIRPEVIGNRLMVKLHFPVFIPIEVAHEMDRHTASLRKRRESPIHQMNQLREGEIPRQRTHVYQGPRGTVEREDHWDIGRKGR